MRTVIRTIAWGWGVAALLGGCGLFSDDTKREPAPLVQFTQSMQTQVVWSTSVGSSKSFPLAPAVVGNAIYAAAADGTVTRVDAASGRALWRASADHVVSAGAGVGDDLVVVGGPDGDVTAFRAADGTQLWHVIVPGELYGQPVVAKGLVILRTSDARLFALDGASGSRRWTLQRTLPPLVLRADAGMTVAGDTLVASFPGGRLLGVNLATGTVRYDVAIAMPRGTTEIERIADVIGSPVIDGTDACVVAYQGRIGCVNAQTGAAVWGRDFSAAVGVAADSRFVFGADVRSNVQAFARGTGVSLWTNDQMRERDLSAPVSVGRAVLFGDVQGYVHALSREEGTFLARVSTDGTPIRVAPRLLDTVNGFQVVVQTTGGSLYAFALQ